MEDNDLQSLTRPSGQYYTQVTISFGHGQNSMALCVFKTSNPPNIESSTITAENGYRARLKESKSEKYGYQCLSINGTTELQVKVCTT